MPSRRKEAEAARSMKVCPPKWNSVTSTFVPYSVGQNSHRAYEIQKGRENKPPHDGVGQKSIYNRRYYYGHP